MSDTGDRKAARVEAAEAKARSKALRPWYRKKRFWLLGAVALVVVIAVSSSGGGDDDEPSVAAGDNGVKSTNSGSNAAADDVELTSCGTDNAGKWAEAEVTITNHSSKRSNYLVEVTFENAEGTKVADGVATTNNLDPDKKAIEEISTLQPVDGEITCKVAEVTRFAS